MLKRIAIVALVIVAIILVLAFWGTFEFLDFLFDGLRPDPEPVVVDPAGDDVVIVPTE
ncbi:hypothetical protein BCF33_1044 [Hasllibacter halocynthiae]|uniref:Uncharacterized protein n=1 Tax=Hasllibacter halocynthiae TaxID=595589 RepID=A0A2T0X982_9RHOB|nr:hypothetical protein [Hasllibacter halocynthiae]PRY95424.1 hypothetical protein BCF33_1044 [Hasllibacter halocynthiae]